MKEYQYYIFDIDGTLTRYRESVRQENFLHHNFLFPIFRDMLVERGMPSVEAERRCVRRVKNDRVGSHDAVSLDCNCFRWRNV